MVSTLYFREEESSYKILEKCTFCNLGNWHKAILQRIIQTRFTLECLKTKRFIKLHFHDPFAVEVLVRSFCIYYVVKWIANLLNGNFFPCLRILNAHE